MERRTKAQIKLEILKHFLKEPDKPTSVMYAANISWQPLIQTVEELLDKGLLEEVYEEDYQRQWKRKRRR